MELLERLIGLFAEHGYLPVFVALLLCGAGVPLPEDITLVAGGVIAGLGHANLHAMMAVTLTGVLVGDAGMFLLGRHYGSRLLKWRLFAWLLPPERFARVQCGFDRYGNRLMFVARFLPGMRTAVYITAGSTQRVSFLRFLLLDGAAALISVPAWVYLGYAGRQPSRLVAAVDSPRPGRAVAAGRRGVGHRAGAVVATSPPRAMPTAHTLNYRTAYDQVGVGRRPA